MAGGIVSGDDELVVWDNGAMVFTIDASSLSWTSDRYGLPGHLYIHPFCLVEYAVSFTRLAKAMYEAAGYDGGCELRLDIRGVPSAMLRPYQPNAWGFMRTHKILTAPLLTGRHSGADLVANPDAWAKAVIADVYHAFGFTDDQIPFFASDGRFETT
jgi:hypothetical protein